MRHCIYIGSKHIIILSKKTEERHCHECNGYCNVMALSILRMNQRSYVEEINVLPRRNPNVLLNMIVTKTLYFFRNVFQKKRCQIMISIETVLHWSKIQTTPTTQLIIRHVIHDAIFPATCTTWHFWNLKLAFLT